MAPSERTRICYDSPVDVMTFPVYLFFVNRNHLFRSHFTFSLALEHSQALALDICPISTFCGKQIPPIILALQSFLGDTQTLSQRSLKGFFRRLGQIRKVHIG